MRNLFQFFDVHKSGEHIIIILLYYDYYDYDIDVLIFVECYLIVDAGELSKEDFCKAILAFSPELTSEDAER